MNHMSEIVSLSGQIKSSKENLKTMQEAVKERLDLLKEYMEAEGIKELSFKDVVFTLLDSSKSARLTAEDKRKHLLDTLQERGVAVGANLIDDLLSFPKEKVETKKLSMKGL